MADWLNIAGRTVVVTGASSGIGKAIVDELLELGVNVANFDIADNGESHENLFFQKVDVTSREQVEAAVSATVERFGTIDALVNNAGILFEQSTIENLSAERINRVLATNVTGYFLCCREAVKRMSFKHGGKGGAIVNVSSAASRLGAPGEYVDYAASKGAVDSLTTGLALEVAAQGIRVNCVRPGLIYTDIHADGGEPGRVDRVKSLLPMQRGGQPEEVAQAIVWLLSEKASYVTGSFIELAGGK